MADTNQYNLRWRDPTEQDLRCVEKWFIGPEEYHITGTLVNRYGPGGVLLFLCMTGLILGIALLPLSVLAGVILILVFLAGAVSGYHIMRLHVASVQDYETKLERLRGGSFRVADTVASLFPSETQAGYETMMMDRHGNIYQAVPSWMYLLVYVPHKRYERKGYIQNPHTFYRREFDMLLVDMSKAGIDQLWLVPRK